MTSVYGDIQAADEFTHPLGPEKNFNESMYFNFFDRAQGCGGFLRIGNRANEGYAEVTVCVYLPTGDVLFGWKRPEIADNSALDAGGLKFEVIEPLLRHRTTYEGTAVFLAEPRQMAEPRLAFQQNPHKPISIDLRHEAAGPVFGGTRAQAETPDPDKEFARVHYEQHMRVSGSLIIEGDKISVDGFGLRDHSWGPRYWQAIRSYRWLNCTFGPDFGIMVSEVSATGNASTQTGVVLRGDSLERVTSVDLKTEFEPNTPYHRRVTADLGLENGGSLALEGEVKSFIPLRNRRSGMVTHIGEGMTEYRCEGRVGLGISEYLDQIR